uniref:tetratricopeptide repeat protein n=1 Tax=Dyadobacter sp. TaxID=1914288 RepID=UPI003F70D9A0
YITRGILFQNGAASKAQAEADFVKANQLNPKEWRSWHYLTNFYNNQQSQEKGLANAQKAYERFVENPVIGLDYAKSLLNASKLEASLKVLDQVNVLPQEGAREGHSLYVTANLAQALTLAKNRKYKDALKSLEKARLWPEHLGTGKPNEPDTRLIDYLAAYCETQLGRTQKAEQYKQNITAYTLNASKESNRNALSNYLGVKLLNDAGEQESADKFLETWKAEQDSLRKWDITAGSDAPEVQWILAKTKQDETRAEKLRHDLIADRKYSATSIFFQALDLAENK